MKAKDVQALDAFAAKYWKDDECVVIRPSGNPLVCLPRLRVVRQLPGIGHPAGS